MTKAEDRATVHRSAYADEVRIRRYDDRGEIIGEIRLLGLFSSDAYTGTPPSRAGSAVDATFARWEDAHAPAVRRARQTLADLEASGRTDLVALSVALRTLRTVLRRR